MSAGSFVEQSVLDRAGYGERFALHHEAIAVVALPMPLFAW